MGEGPLSYSELTGLFPYLRIFSRILLWYFWERDLNILRAVRILTHLLESSEEFSLIVIYGKGTFAILRAARILASFLESSQELSQMLRMGEGPLPNSELPGFSPVSLNLLRNFLSW